MSLPRSYPDDNDQDSEPTPTPSPLHTSAERNRARPKPSKSRASKAKNTNNNEHAARARHSDVNSHKSSPRTHLRRDGKSKSTKTYNKNSGNGGGGGVSNEGHNISRSHPSSSKQNGKDDGAESDDGRHYREEGVSTSHSQDNDVNRHSLEEHTPTPPTAGGAGSGVVKKLPNRKKLLIIAPTENQLPSHAAFDFIHCPVGMERKVMWKHFDVMVLIVPTATSSKRKESMLHACRKAKNSNPKLFVCIIDIEASESAVFRAMCYGYGANMVTNDHHSLKQVLNNIGNKGFKGRGRLTCPYCGMHGLTEDELWHHVPLYHVNETADKKMACPVCHDSQHKSFLVHLRNMHGPVQRGEIAPEYRDGITTHAFALVVVRRPSDSKFLVVQEASNSGFWLPGGRVEVGETLLEAAIRETKEEAGIDVDIRGILKVDFSTYAYDDRRAAYNRMRVIFYAEPCDETELPKSVPNYHSAGATFISVDELDRIELRADEPREWFTALTEHFVYHSLDILSCWKHDQRTSRHHHSRARDRHHNNNNNNNNHHTEGDGGHGHGQRDDATRKNSHAGDKHASSSAAAPSPADSTSTTDSENSDDNSSSLYQDRDRASNDVDDSNSSSTNHHNHRKRTNQSSSGAEDGDDDDGIALVFAQDGDGDDADREHGKRKRERRSDPSPRRLKSNHNNNHNRETDLHSKATRVAQSVPIDASHTGSYAKPTRKRGKDKPLSSSSKTPSSINNLPPVHKNSLKAQSTQAMTTISPDAASHSTSNLKKMHSHSHGSAQKQQQKPPSSGVVADTTTLSMSQSNSAPQLASQSSVAADANHDNTKKETSTTMTSGDASKAQTQTVANSMGPSISQQQQQTVVPPPHQTVTYRIGPSIYTLPFPMMQNLQMQPNIYNQSGASLLGAANGNLVSPSHSMNPMELYSDYMANARRSHIGLPMQAVVNPPPSLLPKMNAMEKQMSADHAQQSIQSSSHAQEMQHMLLQQQIALALQQQQQQQQQLQQAQQQQQQLPQAYAAPYQFGGQHAYFVNQAAHLYSSQPPPPHAHGLYAAQPPLQQQLIYSNNQAAQPMMPAQPPQQQQQAKKDGTPPLLKDSKSGKSVSDVHFDNLNNQQHQPKPEFKSSTDKKTKNKKRQSRVSHPRISSLQQHIPVEVLAPIFDKPKHKNKAHVLSDGIRRKKHRRSLSSGVLPMTSSTMLQSSTAPLYQTTPPPHK